MTILDRILRKGPVEQAKRFEKPAGQLKIEGIALKKREAGLKAAIADFLPVEFEAKQQAEAELQKLNELLEIQEKSRKMEDRYGLFDLTPLTWRDEKGLPKLAVYSLEGGEFKVSSKILFTATAERNVLRYRERSISGPMPSAMEKCYADVFRNNGVGSVLDRLVWNTFMEGTGLNQKESIVSLISSFNGCIPSEAKQKIKTAQSLGFFKSIWLIGEVKEWSLTEKVLSQVGDPLVVGYDGEHFWLITSFDSTPLEAYIATTYGKKVN